MLQFTFSSYLIMSETGYGSLYSVFVFLLAFSIINFYASKVKEEKRFRLEQIKINDLKLLEKAKEAERIKWIEWKRNLMSCPEDSQLFSCHHMEIFVINVNALD